jgi:mono/diheme cytochrome c family protein
MTRRALALLGVTAAVALAGCGGDDAEEEGAGGGAQATETATASATPDETPQTGGVETDQGRQLFVSNCAGCHTLSDAGANGQVGPNLDELQPDAAQVGAAIKAGPGAMPENLVEGADLDAVAEYVATATGGG